VLQVPTIWPFSEALSEEGSEQEEQQEAQSRSRGGYGGNCARRPWRVER
jgi:hypothetical protein